MDIKLLPLYFLIGGAVVTAITYFGNQSKGLVAAFIAFLPTISAITICAIYLTSGVDATLAYARGMLILIPSWALYIVLFIFLLPRIGLAGALTVSVAAYVSTAFLVIKFL